MSDVFYRCPDCKHTFREPESETGETPGPIDKIKCPECAWNRDAQNYIRLVGTTAETACVSAT